jgi:hypothetical protein
MIDDVKRLLVEKGTASDHIYHENFFQPVFGFGPAQDPAPDFSALRNEHYRSDD